jgi:ComF family protein
LSTYLEEKIRSVKELIIDALFPVHCVSCWKEGRWLCQLCQTQIKILDFQVCPVCEEIITEKGLLCPFCRSERKSSLNSLICTVSYEDSTTKKLIHNFKYRFIPDISNPLADFVIQGLIQNDSPLPDLICPVPLHPKRLRWRGFNQSLLLAQRISEELAPLTKIEVLDILMRQRHNPPQMGIKNYSERLKNVSDIFSLRPNSDHSKIKNKKILLVDDVATTGATLEECARILKTSGAKKVFATVICRQSFKK